MHTNVYTKSCSYIFIVPLYQSIKAFQFINTCEQQDKSFVLLPQNILQQLSPISTKLHCNSLVDKYINRHEILNDFFKQHL